MAADTGEPQAVSLILDKLRRLLQSARTVKLETTVDPPLPAGALKNDIDGLGDGVFRDEPESQRHTIVEAAARKAFYQIVVRTPSLGDVN